MFASLPFLSVVIPTFNRRDSLRVTLDALSDQTYPASRYEIIVVSDGSTDGTDAFLADRASRAAHALRPIRQSNAGPARARNRGVEEAAGEVIVFVDDDVEPAPGFLAAHATHHGGGEDIGEGGKLVVIGPMLPDPARARQEPPWIAWEHAMLGKQYENWRTGAWEGVGPNHFYTGNASLRREHIRAVGGFDETFKRQEDVELAYRMERECGLRFCFDAEAAGLHRPHRTFASWLNVPYAYGRLDVVRARRGDISWDMVRFGYISRNRATQRLANWALASPTASITLRLLLRAAAQSAYRFGAHRQAIQALSVLYNVRYLEGAQAELGARAPMRRLLDHAAAPSPVGSP